MDTSLPFTYAEFARWVRDVYNHLYDTPYLRSHPLGDLLLAADARHPAHRVQNLRRALLAAIEALRPQANGAEQPAATWKRSPDWRIYRIFELRYLEGLSPNEAMSQLAVSRSQFFRDHAEGMSLITDTLWEQRIPPAEAPVPVPSAGPDERQDAIKTETDRLFASATWEMISVLQVLSELQPVLEALARPKQAALLFADLGLLPPLPADRVILRHALLNLFKYAISQTADPVLRFQPYQPENEVGLLLQFKTAPAAPGGDLQICARLMSAVGGRFALESGPGACRIILAWPRRPTRILLAVDDNQGMLDLYQRYLAGQNWQVVTARNGSQARQALLTARPAAILLDIMMPEEDGWELLVSFKGEPELAGIPVIICSVINDPQLAASLGAAGCLAKPVTQQALVETLLPWS